MLKCLRNKGLFGPIFMAKAAKEPHFGLSLLMGDYNI